MVWQSVFFSTVVGWGPGKVCTQFAGSMEREIGFAEELAGHDHQVGLTTGYDVLRLPGCCDQSYGSCHDPCFLPDAFGKWCLV